MTCLQHWLQDDPKMLEDIGQKIEQLQSQLSASEDGKERSLIRARIHQLREQSGTGSVLRRSKRYKAKEITDAETRKIQAMDKQQKHQQKSTAARRISGADVRDIPCLCCENGNISTQHTEKHEATVAHSTIPAQENKDKTAIVSIVTGELAKSYSGHPEYDVTKQSQTRSPALTTSNQASTAESHLKAQETPVFESHPGSSKGGGSSGKSSGFSPFRSSKLPSSASKEPESLPTSPTSKEDQKASLGKRRFSKRFRRKSSSKQIASSESSSAQPEQPPQSPRDSGSNPADPATPRSESEASSSSGAFSPRSTSSVESPGRKTSARVLIKSILGKKFFSPSPSKQKSSTNGKNSGSSLTTPDSASTSQITSQTPPRYTSFNANNSNSTLSEPSRKPKTSSQVMAEVLARSRESARSASSASVFLRHNKAAVMQNEDVTTEPVDYESKNLDELQTMLDACDDFEERAKIRKVIRTAKRSKEEKESVKTQVGNGSSPATTRVNFTLQSNAKKQQQPPEKTNSKPWQQQNAKKSSFRAVSAVKFTPSPKSSPSVAAGDRTNDPSTPPTRFNRSELSSSLRTTYRPTFKAAEPAALDRSTSLRLSRPKDFIRPPTKSPAEPRPIFRARKVDTERVTLESVVPQPSSPATAQAASPLLKRSESHKENQQQSPPPPVVPVVPGNKRRSIGILGRVLSVKIGTGQSPRRPQPAKPEAEPESPTKDLKPLPETEESNPVKPFKNPQPDSPQKDLKPLPESEEPNPAKPVTQTSTRTFVLEGDPPPSKLTIVPIIPDDADQSVKVTCSFSPIVKAKDPPASISLHPEEPPKECKAAPPVETFPVVRLEEPEVAPQSKLSSEVAEKQEEFLQEEPESSGVKTEVRSVLDDLLDLVKKEDSLQTSFSSEDNAVEIPEAKSSQEFEEVGEIVEEEPALVISEEQEKNLEETALVVKKDRVETVSIVLPDAEELELSTPDSPEAVEEKLAEIRDTLTLALHKSTPAAPKAEQEEEEEDESSSISEDSDSASSSGEESGDEADMEGRVSVRSRFGANAGSVKSRIMATENLKGSSPTSSLPSSDISKIRSARQTRDHYALKNSEGVASRMNKFASKTDAASPGAAGKARTPNGSSGNGRPSSRVNGFEPSKKGEINNNNSKSPTLTAKFTATSTPKEKPAEKSAAVSRLESASLAAIDDMKSISRETPIRRSRRRFESNETTVIIEKSTTTVTESKASIEITFQGEEIEQVAVERHLEVARESHSPSPDVAVVVARKSPSSASSLSQRSSASYDETKGSVTSEEASYIVTEEPTDESDLQEREGKISPIAEVTTPLTDDSEPRAETRPEPTSEEKAPSQIRTRRRKRSENPSSSSVEAAPQPSDESGARTPEEVADGAARVPGRRRRRRLRSDDVTTSDSSALTTPDREFAALPEEKPAPAAEEAKESPTDVTGDSPDRDVAAADAVVVEKSEDKGESDTETGVKDIKVETEAEVKESPAFVEVDAEDKEASNESENQSKTTTIAVDISAPATVEIGIVEIKVIPAPEEKEEIKEPEVIEEKPAEKAKPSEPEPVAKPVEETPKKTSSEKPETMRYSIDNLSEITEQEVLEKLLDEAKDYDERRTIRSAIRALKRKNKEAGIEPQPKTTGRWQSPATNGRSTTKTDGLVSSKPSSGVNRRLGRPLDDVKENRSSSPASNKSLADKYSLGKKDMATTGTKKVGSIFDRDDDAAPKKTGSRMDLERRQAERRRDLTRNRSMPATSTKDARQMFAKMDVASGGGTKAKKVGRSPTFVVPNANNVKQMLLKWCQAKTRGYESVDITNFSGSWANGMAFCALVHNFFPQAFEFADLDPNNRAHNFDLAFNTAQKYADADPLLETEDMLIMGNRPDSKCVFTYVQSLYNKLRKFEKPLKALSPTIKVMQEIVEVDSNAVKSSVKP